MMTWLKLASLYLVQLLMDLLVSMRKIVQDAKFALGEAVVLSCFNLD